jgi:hypothetical protein
MCANVCVCVCVYLLFGCASRVCTHTCLSLISSSYTYAHAYIHVYIHLYTTTKRTAIFLTKALSLKASHHAYTCTYIHTHTHTNTLQLQGTAALLSNALSISNPRTSDLILSTAQAADYTHDGVAQVLTEIAEKGYKMFYLTARYVLHVGMHICACVHVGIHTDRYTHIRTHCFVYCLHKLQRRAP